MPCWAFLKVFRLICISHELRVASARLMPSRIRAMRSRCGKCTNAPTERWGVGAVWGGVVHCVGISVCATHVTVSHVTKHRCFNRHFQLIAICNRVSSYERGGNMLSTHATKRLTCHHTPSPPCTCHLSSALGARTRLYNVYIGPTLGAFGIASCTAIASGQ